MALVCASLRSISTGTDGFSMSLMA